MLLQQSYSAFRPISKFVARNDEGLDYCRILLDLPRVPEPRARRGSKTSDVKMRVPRILDFTLRLMKGNLRRIVVIWLFLKPFQSIR